MEAVYFSEQVRFLPWIGEDYALGARWGAPLLALGESHYVRDGEVKGRSFTRDCIRWYVGGGRGAFWTRIATLLGAPRPVTPLQRQAFWRTLAFYNFVQQPVGNGSRQRPTERMWEEAGAPLLEVLESLKPRIVLVLGSETWRHLPAPDSRGPTLRASDLVTETRVYGSAVAGHVRHPSAWGSGARWRPLAQAILQAGSQHRATAGAANPLQ